MEVYLNKSGDSPVTHYHIANNFITVKFDGGRQNYTYSYTGEAGKMHVEKMKDLAIDGSGLSAYINQNVRKSYDK